MLTGSSDLELAEDDKTCGAIARYPKFAQMLRSGKRIRTAEADLRTRMTDVVLKEWQEEVVNKLDGYTPLWNTELTWCPSVFGSSFVEFDTFKLHEFPM